MFGKYFCSFSTKICCGYSKDMFKLMGKKIITILHLKMDLCILGDFLLFINDDDDDYTIFKIKQNNTKL